MPASKPTSEYVRSPELEARGWTPELRKARLRPHGNTYLRAEVQAVQRTRTWKEDSARAAAGKPVYWTSADLRKRGWTAAMIRDLIGEPHWVQDLGSRGTRIKIRHHYRVAVVERAEADEGFRARLDAAAKRSARGAAVADRRREELLAAVRDQATRLRVTPPATLDKLEERALTRQQQHYIATEQFDRTAHDADPQTIERWCRNYLRHNCSNYDQLLREIERRFAGIPGISTVYEDIVRPRIDELVNDAFRRLHEAAEAMPA